MLRNIKKELTNFGYIIVLASIHCILHIIHKLRKSMGLNLLVGLKFLLDSRIKAVTIAYSKASHNSCMYFTFSGKASFPSPKSIKA